MDLKGLKVLTVFFYQFTDQVKSYISVNVHQAWQDEQVAVYDCQERLFRYKYVGVTDIDEFIVPYAYTTLQEVIVSKTYFVHVH